jgi:hypothetical protein
LEELHGGVLLHMNAVIVRAFHLYQQMSSPVLRAEWDDIMDKIFFVKGWFDVKGVKSIVKHA